MKKNRINKKIINDPVYGFIEIPSNIIFTIIEHPFFQRLRRISQLGLTYLVFQGATHTRFNHVIGAMHLMQQAVKSLRSKGNTITEEEEEGVLLAILLHDIGHGPYSHTLEHSFVKDLTHEEISILFMNYFNEKYEGKLSTALAIFQNKYPKLFLHQLVSSQLDMDRLDYLARDSFYSGVSEGVVGVDRIIKMLDIYDGKLAVEAKGIYSVEKFLIARRLMYWQVYLHKTVVAAEQVLIRILHKARAMAANGIDLNCSKSLSYFLYNKIDKKKFDENPDFESEALVMFSQLDDFDIMSAIKSWALSDDIILKTLCLSIINRELPAIKISNQPFEENYITQIRKKVSEEKGINIEDAHYFVFSDTIANSAYKISDENINIITNSGEALDIADASDISNVKSLSKTVTKYFLCYPKN